jgi:hypothetical protein
MLRTIKNFFRPRVFDSISFHIKKPYVISLQPGVKYIQLKEKNDRYTLHRNLFLSKSYLVDYNARKNDSLSLNHLSSTEWMSSYDAQRFLKTHYDSDLKLNSLSQIQIIELELTKKIWLYGHNSNEFYIIDTINTENSFNKNPIQWQRFKLSLDGILMYAIIMSPLVVLWFLSMFLTIMEHASMDEHLVMLIIIIIIILSSG